MKHRLPTLPTLPTRLACALGLAIAAAPALAEPPNCVNGINNTGPCLVPDGMTSVTIQAWGAGGGGAGSYTLGVSRGGGGGGGGSYCQATFTVVPGELLAVMPGAGGAGGAGDMMNGGNGAPSTVTSPSISTSGGFGAMGGNGGQSGGLGGIGGSVLLCTAPGAISFAGGTGGIAGGPAYPQGGGGGSSASATAAGANGSTPHGASGWGVDNAEGGGGDGRTHDGEIMPGFSPGGGGGGGYGGAGILQYGANGAPGRVVMTFSTPGPTVPGQPASASATPGDGAVRVDWTAPASDGGAAITGYSVRAYDAEEHLAGTCTGAPTASSCTIAGLANGASYFFNVRAANAEGDGLWRSAGSATPAPLQPTGLTVPGASGGPASVVIGGGQPGCVLDGTPSFSDSGIPDGAPAQAEFPVGAFRFAASGCTGDTLKVTIEYPQALAANVRLMKHTPAGGWFPAPNASITLDRRTVTYTVQDNGPGDSNPAPGAIADPFAPMALPPGSGAAAIPTLSEWGIALLSLLAAAFGLRAARRRV